MIKRRRLTDGDAPRHALEASYDEARTVNRSRAMTVPVDHPPGVIKAILTRSNAFRNPTLEISRHYRRHQGAA